MEIKKIAEKLMLVETKNSVRPSSPLLGYYRPLATDLSEWNTDWSLSGFKLWKEKRKKA